MAIYDPPNYGPVISATAAITNFIYTSTSSSPSAYFIDNSMVDIDCKKTAENIYILEKTYQPSNFVHRILFVKVKGKDSNIPEIQIITTESAFSAALNRFVGETIETINLHDARLFWNEKIKLGYNPR